MKRDLIKARFIIYGNETNQPIVDVHGEIRQVVGEVDKWTTALGFKPILDPQKIKKEFEDVLR